MSLNFFSAFKKLDKKAKLDESAREPEKKIDVKSKEQMKERNVKFVHSMYGKIIRGPRKGFDVEIRYILPSKLEVELGSNVEVVSSKELKIGDIVNNNCVILGKMGDGKYMSYCKRVVYFGEDDVKRDMDSAIIKSGPLKNQRGKIIKVYDAKVNVALSNNTSFTLDESMLFYKDIMLKNGKYFNVFEVKKKTDGSYELRGKIFGDSEFKTINMGEIEKIMNGFKIMDEIKETDSELTLKQDTIDIDDIEDTTEMMGYTGEEVSESESESDRNEYGEESDEEREEEREEETIPKLSYKDLQQAYFMYSGWSKNQKKFLNILKSMGIMEKNVDISQIMSEIEGVLDYFAKKIKQNSRNFDIYNSSIDYRMIIACLFAYNNIERDEFDFDSMEEYVDYLFKREYFMGDVKKSLLLELSDIFPCKYLKTSRFVRDRVKMLMSCYHDILQDVLKKEIKISMKKAEPKYEPVVARERKYDERRFLLPSDILDGKLVEGDMNKNIVWNPTYRERIEVWKNYMKSRGEESEGLKKKFYNLIEMNMDRIPLVLMGLRRELIEYIKGKYADFSLEKCGGNNECIDKMLNEYIQNMISSKLSVEEHEMVYRYISVRDFTNEFINDMNKVRESFKDNALKELKSEMDIDVSEDLNEDAMLRDKIIKWLWMRAGYKLSQKCEDIDCKDREILSKLKGILSKSRNRLLEAEIDMIEDFILFASKKEKKEEEDREIPDAILNIKRKFEQMEIRNN